MKIKKITGRIAAALLGVSMLLSLQGCTVKVRPKKPSAQDSVCVGTVGKQEIMFDEFRYALLNTRDEMEAEYGEDILKEDARYTDELRERTYRALENYYHAVAPMADHYYLGGSAAMFSEPAILELVKEKVNQTATECGSRAKFRKTLKESHMSDRLFRYFITCEECANELMFVLRNDLGVIADDKENMMKFMHSGYFIRTNHIFIKGLSDENAALAESLRRQLSESSDLMSDLVLLKGRYCSDFALTTIHGNYFARYASDYGEEYEQIAFSLAVGEVGEVLKTSSGFWVIARLPLEDEWLEKKYSDFHDMIVSSQFNIELEKFRSQLKFEPNEYCTGIDLLAVK